MNPTNPRPVSGKIQTRHRALQALVYVRQSSLQQVHDHPESRARQYALADHAVTLGWSADLVVVIDEDQGQSGQRADSRAGFQRLLTDVTLGRVGLILGLEMSRLAARARTGTNCWRCARWSAPCWPIRTGCTTRGTGTTASSWD